MIPAHNEARYLSATLAAIQVATEELGAKFEIVVVNDASTDDTGRLAKELGARVVDVELRNIGAVRNAGAAAARYDWLVFVDADTIISTMTLGGTLDALTTGSVGGGARVNISQTPPLPLIKYLMYFGVYVGWQLVGGWAAGCYMFCTRERFEDFGGFDENYYAAEELFFSRNLKSRGRFTIVKHPVTTSARKLHAYSVWELVRFLTRPMLEGRNLFRTKAGLEILYEDVRD